MVTNFFSVPYFRDILKEFCRAHKIRTVRHVECQLTQEESYRFVISTRYFAYLDRLSAENMISDVVRS